MQPFITRLHVDNVHLIISKISSVSQNLFLDVSVERGSSVFHSELLCLSLLSTLSTFLASQLQNDRTSTCHFKIISYLGFQKLDMLVIMVIVIVHPLNLLCKPASKRQNIFVNFDPNSCGQSKRTFQNIFLIFDISTDVNADDDDCDCDCPPQDC